MKKILIIEDDPHIAELERDYLEINNFIIEISNNGNEGLLLAKRKDFDLIIIDLMLPEKNGFDICREIRTLKNIPLLIVSAKNDDIDKVRALGLGADDYITKPFSPNELVARVKAHLRRYDQLLYDHQKVPGKNDAILIGCLKILPKAWRVYLNEKEIKLTNKEFELLLFLATQPNIVFSKEYLFETLWDVNSIGDIATVAVHINRLRDKLEKAPDSSLYIETVWGAGYRFKA